MALPFFLKMYITYFNPHSSPRESVSKYSSRPDKVGYKHSCDRCEVLEVSENLP